MGDGSLGLNKANLFFPVGKPGGLYLDCDADNQLFKIDGHPHLISLLESYFPGLKGAARVLAYSSSSFVGDSGIRGMLAHYSVLDVSDLPRAHKVIYKRLLLQHGGVAVPSDNSPRVRILTLLDRMVGQPTRIIYAFRPLIRTNDGDSAPKAAWQEGHILDTRVVFPDLAAG